MYWLSTITYAIRKIVNKLRKEKIHGDKQPRGRAVGVLIGVYMVVSNPEDRGFKPNGLSPRD